jgi:DNA-binding CsgD family transcriptional regulator/PAS domain-containing protein
MVTVEDFSRLVSGIYAAAVTPEHWESAIREIHRTLGGAGGALLMADGAVWSIQNSILPAGAANSYAKYYCQIDRALAAVEKGPVGAVRTGTELIIPIRNTEFYVDWMRPNELEDGLFVRLTGRPRPTCFVIHAPSGSESLDTPERMKAMRSLVVHLQQAVRTQNQFAALARSSTDLAGALDAVRHGVIIVGSGGQVMNLNTAAESILRAEDGVYLLSGRMASTSMHAECRLNRALQAALVGESSAIRSGRSFTCERPSGKRPYVFHVLPVHRAESDEPSSEARALVLIVDPEHEPEPPAALLRRFYRLTATEADVALRIGRGADLKQIAEELSISVATVRTHVQHVFDKTDTHRPAELVRLLLTLRP